MRQRVYAQNVRAASPRTLILVNWKNVMHVHHLMCRTLLEECHACASSHVQNSSIQTCGPSYRPSCSPSSTACVCPACGASYEHALPAFTPLHVAWQSWQAYYQNYQYLCSEAGRTAARAAPRERTAPPHYQISDLD